MTGSRPYQGIRNVWAGDPTPAVEATPCKPSCCRTPYGHSTARDHIPAWHKEACHCHDQVKEQEQ